MQVWVLTTEDSSVGLTTRVYTSAAEADAAAHAWVANQWHEHEMELQHGAVPANWNEAYSLLEEHATFFWDVIVMTCHDIPIP